MHPEVAVKIQGKIHTLPSYDHTLLTAWKQALPIARQYWQTVREDTRISTEFRKIAEQHLSGLKPA